MPFLGGEQQRPAVENTRCAGDGGRAPSPAPGADGRGWGHISIILSHPLHCLGHMQTKHGSSGRM